MGQYERFNVLWAVTRLGVNDRRPKAVHAARSVGEKTGLFEQAPRNIGR